MVVCGDEGDGTRLSFGSESCGARDRAAFARRGRSVGASETRAASQPAQARSLAELKYHVHRITDVFLACESVGEWKDYSST